MPDDPYALAAELARPVAHGYLSVVDAVRALVISSEQPDVFRLQQHILGLHLHRLRTRRAVTALHIKRRIKPLLALRKPRNVVLAEAHDVNGAEGFPFDEPAVTDIVQRELYWAGRPRHG